MEIEGISAVVSGGASGLGAATVRRLADAGAHVVIIDRDVDRAAAVARESGAVVHAADVGDAAAVGAAIDRAGELGPLRVAVNCAGISRAARMVDRQGEPCDLGLFEQVLRVNLLGLFNCVRLAAAAMSRTEALSDGQRGVIINTASAAAFDGQIGQAAYSATKGAVVAMTLPIARDLAPQGIRVNTIAPGWFDTPIFDVPQGDAAREKLSRDVLFPPRPGHADEFAAMVDSIIANPFLNAETIRLDGGMRMSAK
ncbi:SDR family NAD(P)-dependent oxidoreductase [Mycolicibacterium thermoresistibile]